MTLKMYLKLWFHERRLVTWANRAKDARVAMIVAETHQRHHEREYDALKKDL